MAIGMGFGYGLSQALAAAPAAQLRGNRYAEEEGMRQQQLDINQQAENRAGRLTDAYVATMNQNRTKDLAASVGADIAGQVSGGYGTNPASGVVQQAITGASPVQAPDVSANGNPVQRDANGNAIDVVTGQPTPVITASPDGENYGISTKNAMTLASEKGPAPQSGGQRPGMPTKGIYVKGSTTGGGVAPQPKLPDTGMSSKDVTLSRQGKAMTTPTEGAGYASQADQLEQNASAIEGRLNESIKMIDQKYGNDPTMAAYLKANVRTQVMASLSTMRANATRLRQEGDLANYMQHGSEFAESVMSHINQGGTIDDAWIQSNGAYAKRLGIDPGLLSGMHLNKQGYIANKQGALIPREALMRVANPALPWLERAKGWQEIDNMYKTQQTIAQKWAEVKQRDPEEFVKFGLTMATDLHNKYQALDTALNNALATAITGGPVKVNINGKPQTITLQPKLNRPAGVDWVDGMRTSQDPNDRAYFENVLQPLYSQRSLVGTLNSFVSNMSKSAFRAQLPGQQSVLGGVRADTEELVAEGHARGRVVGEAKGARDVKNMHRIPSK